MKKPAKVIFAKFFALSSSREPVRDWLLDLPEDDCSIIGQDLMKVEFGWPCGPPLCKPLTSYSGLYEVRSNLTGKRIARVFFYIAGKEMILLHGFIKKNQTTPSKELKLAERRMKEHQNG